MCPGLAAEGAGHGVSGPVGVVAVGKGHCEGLAAGAFHEGRYGERLFLPMIRSPSQWPASLRSSTDAGRSQIGRKTPSGLGFRA